MRAGVLFHSFNAARFRTPSGAEGEPVCKSQPDLRGSDRRNDELPTVTPERDPSSEDLAMMAEHGGAFDWLAEEPELYGPDDGEPV
jgi:hypothetical protein